MGHDNEVPRTDLWGRHTGLSGARQGGAEGSGKPDCEAESAHVGLQGAGPAVSRAR
jgi:hypothetical protein